MSGGGGVDWIRRYTVGCLSAVLMRLALSACFDRAILAMNLRTRALIEMLLLCPSTASRKPISHHSLSNRITKSQPRIASSNIMPKPRGIKSKKKKKKRRRCFKPQVSSSSSSFACAVEGRPSAEAVQATEAEAERSATHAVFVDDDSAACEVMVSDVVRAVELSEGVLTGVLAAPVLSPHETHCWLCCG